MDRSLQFAIALNNRAVELLQRGCCPRRASEMFSKAGWLISGRTHSQEATCEEIYLKVAASVAIPASTCTGVTFRVENLLDRMAESQQLNRLFDLKHLQITFSVIRIDDTFIDILGDTKYQVLSMIILYNWGVACLGLAQSQSRNHMSLQHQIYLQALSLLERANKIMRDISRASWNDFDLYKTYVQLTISYAFWQAHRLSVGKRFVQSKTNRILYRRYCRLVRKVQILDQFLLEQTHHCSAAAA